MTNDNMKKESDGNDIPTLMSYTTEERDRLREKPQELNDYLKACLFNAVIEINSKAVQAILEENPDFNVNSKDQYGRSAFAVAYLQKDLQTTYRLAKETKKLRRKIPGKQDAYEEHEISDKHIAESNENDSDVKHAKIISLLAAKTDFRNFVIDTSEDIAQNTELKHHPITASKKKMGTIKQSILHLAAHPETPPSDLIYFLLCGADEHIKDSQYKKPIEYISTDDEEMDLHKKILKIGVPKLFDLENFELLAKIIQKDETQKNVLFENIFKSWLNYLMKMDTDERRGQFLYTLLTYPNSELTKQLKKSILGNYGYCFVVAACLSKAADVLQKTNPLNSTYLYEQAAQLGHSGAMLKLANFYVINKQLKQLNAAVDWYAKYYKESRDKDRIENRDRIRKYLAKIARQSEDLLAKNAAISTLRDIFDKHWVDQSSYQQLSEQIEFLSLLESDQGDHNEETTKLQNKIIQDYVIVQNQSLSDEEQAELYVSAMSNPKLKDAIFKNTIQKQHQAASLSALLWQEGQKFRNESEKLEKQVKDLAVAITNAPNDSWYELHKEKTDKEELILQYKANIYPYFEQAAQLGDINAIQFLTQYYLKNQDPSKAIHFCANAYRLTSSEKSKKIIIDDLKKMIQNFHSSKDDNLMSLILASNKLHEIYQLRWADKTSLITSIEKMEYLSLLEKVKIKDNKERKNNLIENILQEYDNGTLLKDLNDTEKGILLCRLLTHPNLTLANEIKNKLEEGNITKQTCSYINLAANNLDTSAKIKIYEISAEWGDPIGLRKMARYYINSEPQEWGKAITAFRSAYSELTNEYSLDEIADALRRMQYTDDLNKKQAATALLAEISLLEDNFYKSMRRAIEMLPTPTNKNDPDNIELYTVNLGNGLKKSVTRQINSIWHAVDTKLSIKFILAKLRGTVSPIEEFKEFFKLFDSNNVQEIIKKCAEKQVDALDVTKSLGIWASQPDGILKILNQDIDRMKNIDQMTNGDATHESKKTLQEYIDMEVTLKAAMEEWIKHFGNSDKFNKIDSRRQHQLSHRILEFGIGFKNPLAQNLVETLTKKWKDDKHAPKKLLSQFNLRKMKFEAAVNKTSVKKSLYQRLFSNDVKKALGSTASEVAARKGKGK